MEGLRSQGWIRRWIQWVGMLLACLLPLCGQTARRWADHRLPPVFERLPGAHDSVMALHQDRTGFLWMGNDDGLDRFDGHRLRPYYHDRRQPHSLSGNLVTVLYEDRGGHLWVGTHSSGLNRYDAALDRMVRIPAWGQGPAHESLASNGIACMAEDREGRLWIGTMGGGLNLLTSPPEAPGGPRFQWFQPEAGAAHGLRGASVKALLLDRQGAFWVGLEDGGLQQMVRTPGGETRFVTPRLEGPPLPEDVTALAEDRDGRLWVGGTDGLWIVDPGRGTTQAYRAGDGSGLPGGLVKVLHADRTGGIWLGMDGGGLVRPEPWRDAQGRLRFHVFRHDPEDPGSLPGNAIEALYEDRHQVLWVAVYQGGLHRLRLHPDPPGERELPRFDVYRPRTGDPGSFTGRVVNGTLEDSRGRLWIATDGQGLHEALPGGPGRPLRFVTHRARKGVPGGLQDDVITCLMEDRKGRIWLGTYTEGLVRMDLPAGGGPPRFTHHRQRKGDPRSLASNFVSALLEDPSGRIWVGTVNGGLHLFDPEQGTSIRWGYEGDRPGTLGDASVNAMVMDRFGTLWVATVDGISRFHPGMGRFKVYRPSTEAQEAGQHLPGRFIRTLHLDPSGTLWVGTQDGGLCATQPGPWEGPEPVFRTYGPEHGILSSQILDILDDGQGRLWVCGNRGVVRLDPARGRSRPVPTLQRDMHGVNRRGGTRTRSGDVVLGGRRGFVLFRPEEFREDPVPPRPVLVDLSLFGRPVPPGQEDRGRILLPQAITQLRDLELSHRDAVVTFSFAALHLMDPAANRLAHRLEGMDPDWVETGDRPFATYTTLPPGTYRLYLKAANADGVWSEPELALRVRVLPPFWRRTGFLAGAGLVLVAAVLGIHWLRLRSHLRNEARLGRLVQERTAALEEANRELDTLARKDPLTGLANVRAFREVLAQTVARAIRAKHFVGVILLDVDFFKGYNDALGHPAGDACLKEVAAVLAERVRRAGDLAARYGGEEFVVLLDGADREQTLRMAEGLREALVARVLPHPTSKVAEVVTASFGCAACIPDLGFEAQDLVTRADLALYEAKGSGRNRVVLSDR